MSGEIFMDNPYFSIITVCKNEEERIAATIQSVLMQSFQDYEYIIVDGLSSDGTIYLIQNLANAKDKIHYISENDNGIYDAMNKGIGISRGKFIFFLNAGDEFFDNNVLQNVWSETSTIKKQIFVGSIYVIGNINKRIVVPSNKTETFEKGIGYYHQAVFSPREFLTEGFNIKYHIYADYDWECKQYIRANKFHTSEVLICRYNENGISSQNAMIKQRWEELFAIWKKYFPKYYCCRMNTYKEDWELEKGNIRLKILHELYDLTLKNFVFSALWKDKENTNIAIYGFGDVGQCFLEKLKAEGVKKIYIIDRYYKNDYDGVTILRLDDSLPNIDICIVTSIVDYVLIREEIKKRNDMDVISLEQLISMAYEKINKMRSDI